MMSEPKSLEQLEHQVDQLPPNEQLKLVTHITQRLSAVPFASQTEADAESLRQQREKEVDELLTLCDTAAEMWKGKFDAVEEIRQMRRDRDEQIWPSNS